VDDVTLAIEPGEIVLIMGPSGSGKTTLLSMLGALLRPTSGEIWVDGSPLGALRPDQLASLRAAKIGFIFQAFHLLEALSVEENILLPASLLPWGRGAARKRAVDLIDQVGLLNRRRARPGTLSGGEMQRVAIARALINQPRAVLADEPTGNLDSHRGQEVMMILHDVARVEGRAVLIVSHDPRVEDVADRILWLEDGQLRDRKAEPHMWVRDPICGMRVDAWTATIRSTHGGTEYIFCSERCRERFRKEPQHQNHGEDG
jgi:putative ABC transport system ATP-binding protein